MDMKICGTSDLKDISLPKLDSARELNEIGKIKEVVKTEDENFSEEDLKKATDKLNKVLEEQDVEVKYERHDKFKNTFVVTIVQKSTNKVIREIPPKKILDMVAEMCKLAGIIIDGKA